MGRASGPDKTTVYFVTLFFRVRFVPALMPTHCFLLFYVGLTHGVPASNSNSDVVKKKIQLRLINKP